MAKPKSRKASKPKKAPPVRKRKVREETGSNMSDQMVRDFTRRAIDAHEEIKRIAERAAQARGVYSAVLKDAKKASIHPDNIKWFVQIRDRDPAEIDAETRERTRIARVMKMPLGTQLGLFEDGASVASRIVQDGGNGRDDDNAVAAAGLAAGKAGKTRTVNPWPLKSESFRVWDESWLKGQAAIAAELGAVNGTGADLR